MIQRLHDGLISLVEWADFLRRNRLVSGEGLQNASGERSVKLFEQLQEEHAYLVAVGQQLIAAGMRDLLDQSLGPQLPQVITQGAECIVGRRKPQRLQDLRIQLSRGESAARSQMGEAEVGRKPRSPIREWLAHRLTTKPTDESLT